MSYDTLILLKEGIQANKESIEEGIRMTFGPNMWEPLQVIRIRSQGSLNPTTTIQDMTPKTPNADDELNDSADLFTEKRRSYEIGTVTRTSGKLDPEQEGYSLPKRKLTKEQLQTKRNMKIMKRASFKDETFVPKQVNDREMIFEHGPKIYRQMTTKITNSRKRLNVPEKPDRLDTKNFSDKVVSSLSERKDPVEEDKDSDSSDSKSGSMFSS